MSFPLTTDNIVRPDFPKVIDNTIRGTFVNCPRKMFHSTIENLKSERTSVHLVAGGAFARGLEVFRRNFYDPQNPLFMNKTSCLTLGLVALIKEWGTELEPEGDDANKTLWNMMLALEYYFDEWDPANDFLQPYMLDGKPAVECTFAIPIPGIVHPQTGGPIMYAGRYDMLGTYGGQLFINDEKTTKQLGPYWSSQWDLNSQFTGYVWAARQYGYPVVGAIVRGLGILKYEFKSMPVLQYRAEWELERWIKQLQQDVKRMIRCWEEGYWDYALGDACSSYGGCTFKKLCLGQNYKDWIPGNYKVQVWNPLRKVSGDE